MSDSAWIVTALRNEVPYLLEWVAHHRAMGFDEVLIFTGHSEDGTHEMAARLQVLGLARHAPLDLKPGRDPMRYGLRELLPRLQELQADWALPVDIDEFLRVDTGAGKVADLVEASGQVDAISVCRKVFGSSGQRGLPDDNVRSAFTRTFADQDQVKMVGKGLKTLFRPEAVSQAATHRPYFKGNPGDVRWVDGGGSPMPEAYFEGKWSAHDGFSNQFARLHYYPVPSPEAFVLRRGQPDDNKKRHALLQDWRKLDAASEADDRMAALVDRSAPLLDQMRADPELARIEQAGRAWHDARMAEILQDTKLAELCAEMTNASRAEKARVTRSSPRSGGGRYAPPPVRPVRFDVKPSSDGQCRAVLHGGFHKTATTYLQKLLEGNEAWLGRQSVYVVPHQKLRKHITFPSQLDAYNTLNMRRRTKFSEEDLQGFSQAFFAEPLALMPNRFILSDENIPGLPSHCVTTGTLYQYRKPFFQCFAKRIPMPVTDAFFAVRNYADFFASAYVEYLRSATATTSGKMITPEEMRRNVLSKLPSWQSVLADFTEIFPGTRIHVWRFEDFRALTPRILQLFCGDGVDISKLKDKKTTKTRPTASARAVEQLVLISELEGAGAMAERSKDVQDAYPLDDANGKFDPWSMVERNHLGALYDKDWQAIKSDPRLTVVEP